MTAAPGNNFSQTKTRTTQMQYSMKLIMAAVALCAACDGQAFAQTTPAAGTPAAVPPPPPPPKWEGSISAGLTITRGNSQTTMLTGAAAAKRKWGQNELELGGDGTYGTDHGVKNNEMAHGFGQYNRLLTDKFYLFGRGDALYDGIADIDYRVTLSAGPGYYFIKNERTFFRVEVGPGYVFENVGGDAKSYWTARIAERFEHKLTKTAKIWEAVEILPDITHIHNYVINSEAGIEVAIDAQWSLKTYFLDTYDNEPAPNRQKNDFKLVAAVGYKF
nr:hypothetical protein [uncultured bacterium]